MKSKSALKKTNAILRVIFVAFLIILFRVWHLEVIQKEEKCKEAEHPKQRTIVLKADRGMVSDRFDIPLAINKICYNATISYNQISQIPSTAWKEDETKGHVRWYPRREYISSLSEKLGQLLGLDPTRIEDLIHSKASLFPHVPYLLKSNLSEEEYHQLAFLEKDWLGIQAEIGSERFYPRGKAGAEVIGSMGSISSKEYFAIAEEIRQLQSVVDDWEQERSYEPLLPPPSFERAAQRDPGHAGRRPSKLPHSFAESCEIERKVLEWTFSRGAGERSELASPYRSGQKAKERLQELKEKAYGIQDLVGKSGIEGKFEQQLRGLYGKKIFEVDPKGKCLKELETAKEPISGQQIGLTISIELQEFAEALLAENEVQREGRSFGVDPETKQRKPLKQPWIKGGAIVAIDPNTGEVLAMASTPRFDPNDFVPSSNNTAQSKKQKNISRWLENERLIASIWDGRQEMVRECFSPTASFYDEARPLTWELFLETLLPQEGPLMAFFSRIDDVKTAVQIQEDFEALLYYCNLRAPSELLEKMYPRSGGSSFLELIRSKGSDAQATFKRLDLSLSPLSSNPDRLFAIDLCRLAIYAPAVTDESLKILSSMKLGQYRALNQGACRLEMQLKEAAQNAFRKKEFVNWRKLHQKTFLAEKRKSEKERKIAPRPFIDYLDAKERELFLTAWKEKRLDALAKAVLSLEPSSPLFQVCSPLTCEETKAIFQTFRSFDDLQRPLLGSYRRLRNWQEGQLEKHLAAAFYPIGGFGHSRSYAFQAAAPQGSIFKLVTGYAALLKTGGENPLSLVDEVKLDLKGRSLIVANTPSGAAYPRIYKGGRLPKSANPRIGKIDLIGAIEHTSNSYFSILAGDILSNPEDLGVAARLFGFGLPTGIDLFGEQAGNLPDDLSRNRTGLYSTAIGQHTLLSTPLQTAIMLSAIANHGKVLKPLLVKGDGKAKVIRTIDLPRSNRDQLLEGMDRVLWSSKGTARPGIIRGLLSNPTLLNQYLSLRHQLVGKTSTAEILFNSSLNPSSNAHIYNHVWFGAISFEGDSQWDRPELVVVVLLRYGGGGKDAAPLAAQMVHKWREIKAQHR